MGIPLDKLVINVHTCIKIKGFFSGRGWVGGGGGGEGCVTEGDNWHLILVEVLKIVQPGLLPLVV